MASSEIKYGGAAGAQKDVLLFTLIELRSSNGHNITTRQRHTQKGIIAGGIGLGSFVIRCAGITECYRGARDRFILLILNVSLHSSKIGLCG